MRNVFVIIAFSVMTVGLSKAQTPPVDPAPKPTVQTPPDAQPPASTPPSAPAPAAPAPVQIPPVSVPAALLNPPLAPLSPAGVERRSRAVRAMEVLLAQQVKESAALIARQMQAIDPGVMLLTGTLRARGFMLEGYGVFFDVEIPSVRPSVAWYVQRLQRDRPGADPAGPPIAGAQRTSDTVLATEAFLDDPDRHYVESVKSALIDAMLEYSKPMELRAQEWFTVAASDSGGPMVPGEVYIPPTMVLGVRGGDLADYLAGRLTLEEARKKVEVRKF